MSAPQTFEGEVVARFQIRSEVRQLFENFDFDPDTVEHFDKIAVALVENLIERYLTVEYFTPDDLNKLIVEVQEDDSCEAP